MVSRSCVVEEPAHAEKQHAREPGDLLDVLVERSRPVREGDKPNGGRARSGEVGLRHSTDEPAEQRGLVFHGGWGGKGVDQGETSFDLTRSRHSAGVRVSHGLRDVRRVSFAATIQGKSRMR